MRIQSKLAKVFSSICNKSYYSNISVNRTKFQDFNMKEKERDRVKETERDAKQARFFLVRRGNVKEPCLVWKRARRREGAFDKTATNRGVKRDGRERPSLCLSLVKRISCGELWARIHASVTSTRLRARSRLTKRGEEKRRRSTVSSRQARLASTMLRP